MYEDIIGTNKKNVCKKCGSDNIEISEKMGIIHSFPHKHYRRFVRCYTCNNTYYVTNKVNDTSVIKE